MSDIRVRIAPSPTGPAPHRHRAHGPVQLPVRPPHRRHVRPSARGHRRRPQHRGVRAATSSTASTGWGIDWDEGPARRRPRRGRARTRPTARWQRLPTYAAAAAPLLADGSRPIPATARPRSSTPTAGRRRRRSRRRATSVAARRSPPTSDAAREAEGRAAALRFRVRPGRRRLGRPRPRPGRDRHRQPRRRLRHRPGRRHAALPLHGGRRRHGDARSAT